MKFSIKGFFSKSDQIRRKLRTWSHLQKKSLMENFIFCVISVIYRVLEKVEEEQAEGVLTVPILITQAQFKKPIRILVKEPIDR